jgi:hypothetical protein
VEDELIELMTRVAAALAPLDAPVPADVPALLDPEEPLAEPLDQVIQLHQGVG